MWADPDWAQMLKESEAVALVQVIEGGKFIAKVKVMATFRGKDVSEFFVTGYNNHQWPKEAIEEQSLQKRQQYYLFLKRQKEDPDYLKSLAMEAEKMGDAELKKFLGLANTDALWYVWTPSSGDLRVEKDKVHYSLLRTSYPDSAPLRDRAEFERFLKAAIAYQADAKTDSGLLEGTLQAIHEHAMGPVPPEAQESDLAHSLATYYLLGGRAYGDVFETIAASKDGKARFILARLLGGITGERARKLLLTMLADPNSLVQGEVVRQLAKSGSKEVGAILLERLTGAGEGGSGPQGIMDPVQNRFDGGKREIIRTFGELKYQPAAPALIHLLEVTEDEYSLRILLEALDKMGNREYARALEKPLTKEPLIYTIAEWTRDHRLTELKGAFEQLLDHPPTGVRRLIDMSAVSRALGAIGDDGTAVKLAEQLDSLSSQKVAEVHAQGAAMDMIGALAEMRYHPARSAVARSFFYWFGIDAVFATNSELLKTKQRLQRDVESEVKKCLSEFRRLDAEALVFLQNRGALANGSEIEPNYTFALEVGIRSQEHLESKADSLQSRLVKAFGARGDSIGVTRWIRESYGESSGGNDARLGGRNDSLFLWRWAQYVQATHDPEDLRFARFLLESGLAGRWGAEDSIKGVFGSVPIE